MFRSLKYKNIKRRMKRIALGNFEEYEYQDPLPRFGFVCLKGGLPTGDLGNIVGHGLFAGLGYLYTSIVAAANWFNYVYYYVCAIDIRAKVREL